MSGIRNMPLKTYQHVKNFDFTLEEEKKLTFKIFIYTLA